MTSFLFHTIRFTQEPSWQPWGDVEAAAGDIGMVPVVGCAELDADLHVLAIGEKPPRTLQHAIRRTATLDWQPFNDVEATAAGNPGALHAVAACHVGGDLHVVGSAWTDLETSTSKIVHTIRFSADPGWQPFGDVTASPAGNPSALSRYGDIGCAEVGADLHVVVAGNGPGGKGVLFHTIRFTQEPDWQPFGNVNEAAGGADKSFRAVACAELGGDLHVIATDQEGLLWHTIRFTEELSWQPFGNASAAAGNPDARFSEIACATVNNDLHVIGVTTGDEILHTIRFTEDPRWQPFGSVSDVLGPFPQDERLGRIESVGCSGVGGDLHVCVGLLFRP